MIFFFSLFFFLFHFFLTTKSFYHKQQQNSVDSTTISVNEDSPRLITSAFAEMCSRQNWKRTGQFTLTKILFENLSAYLPQVSGYAGKFKNKKQKTTNWKWNSLKNSIIQLLFDVFWKRKIQLLIIRFRAPKLTSPLKLGHVPHLKQIVLIVLQLILMWQLLIYRTVVFFFAKFVKVENFKNCFVFLFRFQQTRSLLHSKFSLWILFWWRFWWHCLLRWYKHQCYKQMVIDFLFTFLK